MGEPESVDRSVGTVYGDSASDAIHALERLWQADLDEVREILGAPTESRAWSECSLSWLVRPGADLTEDRPGGLRIGASDIAAVRVTCDLFAQLDERFGGGHARRALIQYLRSDVAALLSARYSKTVGRQLHAAVAQTALLAAWMSYDAGLHGLAQRYFVQALRLAQSADDVLLAGGILDAMSHQATYLAKPRDAANLARAARTGTRGCATATLTAHFHVMEARALAAAGDARDAQRALGQAVRMFERRSPENDPQWIRYFDDAEMASELSHTFGDLQRGNDAVASAGRYLASGGGSVRTTFFVTMKLAGGYLDLGEIEEACRTVRHALDLGSQLKSARCEDYVREFRSRASRFAGHRAYRDLTEGAVGHRLWDRRAAREGC
ncbi:hypothetical protein [Plantactinospora endophytica]|uniref:Transcriptional regulator n=1 Tax=Plantactinospora endophytica TaxID=673535 RepID=A0ABQ4DRQ7_9ACTN|nr:hypothetical protein [Plantactinospora endophytica]GIG85137.1 hypothetical protein Pen02_00730 [Plantactinospora endophytica]